MKQRNQAQFAIEDPDLSWLGAKRLDGPHLLELQRSTQEAKGKGVGLSPSRTIRLTQRVMFGLIVGLAGGLVGGFVFGLLGGLIAAFRIEGRIEAAEDIRFEWRDAKSRLSFGLAYGAIFGLAFGLVNGPIGGLGVGLLTTLFEALLGGLRPRSVSRGSAPNRETLRSLRSALRIVLLGWALAFSLVALCRIGASQHFLSFSACKVVTHAAAWIAFAAIIFGGEKGGWFAIRHYTVRLLLWWRDLAPLMYVQFLNETVERLFLIRRGGSYEFLHLTFRDYIATNYGPGSQSSPQTLPRRQNTVTQHVGTAGMLYNGSRIFGGLRTVTQLNRTFQSASRGQMT
jgi:hypothetical protein